MESEDVQERTPEGIREDFRKRVERLRGQARELKDLLQRSEERERARSKTEIGSFRGQGGLTEINRAWESRSVDTERSCFPFPARAREDSRYAFK
jgi:hypothetical protein